MADKDVGRTNIAMQDPVFLQVAEAGHDLSKDRAGVFGMFCKTSVKLHPIDEFHQDVAGVSVFENVCIENPDDVTVVDAVQHLDLVDEIREQPLTPRLGSRSIFFTDILFVDFFIEEEYCAPTSAGTQFPNKPIVAFAQKGYFFGKHSSGSIVIR